MKKISILFIACFFLSVNSFASAFDTQVGTFNNVVAYSNGTVGNASSVYNTASGINTGMKWQCVEYVNRYYYSVYGLDLKSTGIYGNANHYYSNAALAGLNAYPNSGTTAPQVGDIICSNGGTYGHIAIIREVGTTYIKVIHQNWSNDTNDDSKTLTRSGNTIGDFNSTYPVVGWLRKSQAASPTCTFNVSVEGTAQSALTQGWKFWQMTNSNFYRIYGTILNLPSGSNYAIWLADENGNPTALVIGNQSASTFDFSFQANSPYNNGSKYTLIFCPQGINTTIWTKSPWFYMSALPTLSISVTSAILNKGQQATVNWSVNGGISSLADGGWTNNIRLQWYQNNQALENLVTVPVANHSYTFTAPSSISGGTVPGCQFKISGSNPDNTSIKAGYVYGFTNEFCIQGGGTAIDNVASDSTLHIYPNPANDKLVVETAGSIINGTLTVCSLNGQELIKQPVTGAKTQIDISKLANGCYLLKLENSKTQLSKTFIKE